MRACVRTGRQAGQVSTGRPESSPRAPRRPALPGRPATSPSHPPAHPPTHQGVPLHGGGVIRLAAVPHKLAVQRGAQAARKERADRRAAARPVAGGTPAGAATESDRMRPCEADSSSGGGGGGGGGSSRGGGAASGAGQPPVAGVVGWGAVPVAQHVHRVLHAGGGAAARLGRAGGREQTSPGRQAGSLPHRPPPACLQPQPLRCAPPPACLPACLQRTRCAAPHCLALHP